jgi:hypothetical protein
MWAYGLVRPGASALTAGGGDAEQVHVAAAGEEERNAHTGRKSHYLSKVNYSYLFNLKTNERHEHVM